MIGMQNRVLWGEVLVGGRKEKVNRWQIVTKHFTHI
jgi:hypothetical protein